MNQPFKPCFLIPVYNHEQPLPGIVQRLSLHGLPIILVDDGSRTSCAAVMDQLAQDYSALHLLRLPVNRGKGGAVKAGLLQAQQLGFTHAVQIDADGQHNLQDVPVFLAAAQANPVALIIGKPQFDQSIPKLRLYARYLTHVWVWINTLSLRIADSMCGYRVYPLSACCALLQQHDLEERMAFDVEILVRLDWQGVAMVTIPTQVHYPEDGVSHFRGFEDNWRISLTHARLFCGMLWRLPLLIGRWLR